VEEGLKGELRVGDFSSLPYDDNCFDLVIDRGALVCVGESEHVKAIDEVQRVLKKGGVFHYNGYADSHSSSRSGDIGCDGVRVNIKDGSLVGVGQLYFVSRLDIDRLFKVGWKLLQVQRKEYLDMASPSYRMHSEWLVHAVKS
jgi:hypothetical protein